MNGTLSDVSLALTLGKVTDESLSTVTGGSDKSSAG